MTRQKRSCSVLALCASALLSFVACGGDDDGTSEGTDAGPGDDGAVGFICDPAGAFPAMGALLNAPVENDVEVIVKEPQHPGDPGPANLP